MKKLIVALSLLISLGSTYATTLTVTDPTDTVGCTSCLRTLVGTSGPGDTIDFALPMPTTITLTQGQIFNVGPLVILGPGGGNIRITTAGAFGAFFLDSDAMQLELNGLEFFDCADANGGAVTNDGGTLKIVNCNFNGNHANVGDGGAIQSISGGVLEITGSTFSGNSAAGWGGAIYCNGLLSITGSFVNDNRADDSGGGIFCNSNTASGTCQIQSTSFDRDSTTSGDGGGLNLIGSQPFNINNCQFNNCVVGGNYGGGIYTSNTTFFLNNSDFTSNYAFEGGGLSAEDADMSGINCKFSHNVSTYGGGINWYTSFGGAKAVALGDMNVSLYHFENDSAQIGGGMYLYGGGTSSMTNCTFERCKASQSGGAYFQEDHDMSFSSCTFSGNDAAVSGGAITGGFFGNIYMLNSTIAFNSAPTGGGIDVQDVAFMLENCLIGLNEASTAANIYDPFTYVSSYGYNLISDTTGIASAWNPDPTDMLGSSTNYISPKLLPLTDNGGGIPTHQLWSCSPAIDAGSPFSTGNDANGNPRDANPDVGASEYIGTPDPNYTVMNNFDSGTESFRYAVEHTCADTILFDAATDGITTTALSSIEFDRDLTVIGNGTANTLFEGSFSGHGWHILPGLVVDISGLTMEKYENPFNGGAIWNEGDLTLNHTDFNDNESDFGGAIYSAETSNLIVNNCIFEADTSNFNDGGGIGFIGLALVVDSSRFGSCHASYAGAIGCGDNVSITNTQFLNNSAVQQGGAVKFNNGLAPDLNIANCIFNGNSTSDLASRGGALYIETPATAKVDSCKFSGNEAGDGASLYHFNGRLELSNSEFRTNMSHGTGGGDIYISGLSDSAFVWNCAVTEDTATTGGTAGLWIENSIATLSRNTISGNYSGNVPGIYVDNSVWTSLDHNTILQNNSTGGGTGLSSMNSLLELEGNVLAENIFVGAATEQITLAGTSTVTSMGYNLVSNGTTIGTGVTWQATDSVGSVGAEVDPMLDPLAYNDGGSNWTKTHAPVCESPIIDAGSPSAGSDQYGNAFIGAAADMGAYEHQIVFALPTATLTGSVAGCGDGTYNDSLQVDFTGVAPYSFTFGDGVNAETVSGITGTYYIHPDSAGTYMLVSVSDSLCPTGAVSGTGVVADSIISVNITADIQPACDSTDGQVTAAVSGSPGPFSYEWSNGDITATADTIGAGYHLVQVTDQVIGCEVTGTVLLNNFTGPTIGIDAVTPVSCPGAMDGAISATMSGAAPFEINWSNGANTEDIMAIPGGYYIVQVKDADRCVTLDSVFVFEANDFNAFYNIAPATCGLTDGAVQVVVSGGTPGYTYSWNSGSTTNTETAIGLGLYTVTVQDANSCSFVDSVYVGEAGGPTMVVDSIVSPDCSLSNGAIYITATGSVGMTFNWNSGTYTTEDITSVDAGNYILTITDGSCTSGYVVNLPSRTPDVTQICLATVDSATGNNIVIWEEEPGIGLKEYWIYRKALFGGSYEKVGVRPIDSLSFFVDTVANTDLVWWNYKLRTVDSCGSASGLSESVNHKTIHLNLYPAASAGDLKLVWNDYEGFTFDKYYINEHTDATGWQIVDSVDVPTTTYTRTLPMDTTGLAYFISVTSSEICTATKAIGDFNSSRSNRKATVAGGGPSTLFEEDVELTIFPNPTSDKVNVSLKNGVSEFVELRDISGKLLMRKELNGQTFFRLDLSNYEAGAYFMTVNGENYQLTRQLIKQ